MARTWTRWLPAGAAVALVAGTVTLTSQAGAADLPDKSPADVLTMLAEHEVRSFSGTFETSADLGLPLPQDIDLGPGSPDLDDAELGGPGGSEPGDGGATGESADALAGLALLTGDNTGRIFVGGPGQARLQQLGEMAERNVVVNEDEAWFYDSETNEATHLLLPAGTDSPDHHQPGEALPSPEQLASTVVTMLEPSTELSVGQHERVAGRDAYTLELAPRAAESVVAGVRISVDGETGFPLGITVTAQGQDAPALHAAYTDIDFDAPDASLFEFTPPAGATVEEETLELTEPSAPADLSATTAHGPGAPEVRGEGWGSVVVLPAGEAELTADPLLAELTDPVDGGRMLSTALVNVLITDDGQVLAGAVTPEHLLALSGQ